MSDILIRGMEMPEHCGYCRFRYDGICHALQKTQYSMDECPLVPIPPHGRVIDADELAKELQTSIDDMSYLYIYESQEERDCITRGLVNAKDAVSSAPTILPASE